PGRVGVSAAVVLVAADVDVVVRFGREMAPPLSCVHAASNRSRAAARLIVSSPGGAPTPPSSPRWGPYPIRRGTPERRCGGLLRVRRTVEPAKQGEGDRREGNPEHGQRGLVGAGGGERAPRGALAGGAAAGGAACRGGGGSVTRR